METIVSIINSPEVTILGAAFKLLLSLLLGAIVGVERRRKGQIAGMRTFALISMGATLAMLVSIYIPQEYLGLKNGDPGRIAAQVVSGIGFLGAGAIIQMKGSVRGLTTAAGIWASAAIGLAVGAGMYAVSIICCFLILFILTGLDHYEHRMVHAGESKIIRLKVEEIITDIDIYRSVFAKYNVHISEEFLRYDYTRNTTILNFMVRTTSSSDIVTLFSKLHEVGPVLSITLTNEVNN